MKNGTVGFIILGILNIIIAIAGLCIWGFIIDPKNDVVLVMISVILSLTTFFGFMAISQSLDNGLASKMGSMRSAIASGILVLYFFILSAAVFLTHKAPLSDIGQSMVTNFTTTISILIPFYFGTSAYVQAHAPKVDEPAPDRAR